MSSSSWLNATQFYISESPHLALFVVPRHFSGPHHPSRHLSSDISHRVPPAPERFILTSSLINPNALADGTNTYSDLTSLVYREREGRGIGSASRRSLPRRFEKPVANYAASSGGGRRCHAFFVLRVGIWFSTCATVFGCVLRVTKKKIWRVKRSANGMDGWMDELVCMGQCEN